MVPTAQSHPWDWTVSYRGAGPIRIGMSVDDARRALGDPMASLDAGAPPPATANDCAYLSSAKLPDGFSVMLESEKVTRVDVYKRGVRTVCSGPPRRLPIQIDVR
jgi:hypothetical protein